MSNGSSVAPGLRGDATTAAGEAVVAAILANGLIARRGDMSNEEAADLYESILKHVRYPLPADKKPSDPPG